MVINQDAGFFPLFTQAAMDNASDIHLNVNLPPVLRVHGQLKRLEDKPPYIAEVLLAHINQVLSPELQKRYVDERELDTVFTLPTGERFRVNLFWELERPAVAARFIPATIPTLDDLIAPEAVYDFVTMNRGLVLVTGPTGAGKSTLLAAMIEEINKNRAEHIVTLEDPIEFLYTPKRSIIAQRQFGQDFLSFDSGLKHVLRQDPNVILVGEMRDLDTIAATMTLAETGHLVFATLHTNSAAETIDRIVDSFPSGQQSQIRLQLAFVLRGIIAKILVPKVDGTQISAHEVLINNVAIANLIRESKTNQIQNVLYSSTSEKMHTLDQDLQWLLQEGFISRETAIAHAHIPSTFDGSRAVEH
jgi:twitching motility protein PilT